MLTYFQTSDKNLTLLQNNWKTQLDPVLSNPSTNMSFLKNIQLQSGVNVINHLLGKTQQGWILTDIQGPATIYRSAPFNGLTLSLMSSAPVIVTIGVF